MGYIKKENTHLDGEAEAIIRRKGYNVEEIRDHAGQLTERPLQRNLKRPDRNRHINRCVCTSFDNKRLLVCDFDDLVISLSLDQNCKRTGKKHWFVKQDPFRMPRTPRLRSALHPTAGTTRRSNQVHGAAGGCYG